MNFPTYLYKNYKHDGFGGYAAKLYRWDSPDSFDCKATVRCLDTGRYDTKFNSKEDEAAFDAWVVSAGHTERAKAFLWLEIHAKDMEYAQNYRYMRDESRRHAEWKGSQFMGGVLPELGTVFSVKGKPMSITGYNARAPKMPYMAREIGSDREFKMPYSTLAIACKLGPTAADFNNRKRMEMGY